MESGRQVHTTPTTRELIGIYLCTPLVKFIAGYRLSNKYMNTGGPPHTIQYSSFRASVYGKFGNTSNSKLNSAVSKRAHIISATRANSKLSQRSRLKRSEERRVGKECRSRW